MKKLLGIFAVSALTILGCTTAFASNSVQGDADTDGILTAKDSAYVLQKTLDSTFKVPMADEEYSVYCDVNGDKVYVREDRAQQIYYGDIWYTQGGALLAPENGTIDGQDDFDPSKTVVGYTPGTIWQTTVEGWAADGKIKEARATGDQTESIVALQNGKIDAFLTDSPVVENLMKFQPETLKGLKLCSNYKDTEAEIGRIAPSVKFGNEDFMKDINKVVAEMRDEGVLDQIYEKYGLDPKLHAITNDQKDNGLNK